MVEFKPRQPGPKGYALDPARIRYDLYRLLASVYGSERFLHSLEDFTDAKSLANLAGEFEADELNHLLLTIAISVRETITRWRVQPGGRPIADLPCGELEDPKGVHPLTFRGACDKVIHAEKVNLDFEDAQGRVRLNPIFYLYGTHFGAAWKARLDLEQFAAAVLEF